MLNHQDMQKFTVGFLIKDQWCYLTLKHMEEHNMTKPTFIQSCLEGIQCRSIDDILW